ncbi:UDP-N-acetylglucosamine--N-acetylmuramyl-(pentapeptide) pyrophosphoryl-undecaprenol N-acetylglucosamine transferase, partial [bacterium]|nr:UDP-N-acetylglucosamine--N-acetylmuramyl-(pentapeptide) pyrophosphoryl-undecaprenol N-acetylglucosamine transferase [bacterium]
MPDRQPSLQKIRIIIAGGGTGGHLFPGISIAEEFLEQRSCDIRFVGTKNGIEKKVIPQSGFKLYTLPVSGLYRVGTRKKIIALAKLPFAFLKSLWILLSFRPHLVIGVGGYASGPMLALAVLFFKKTVIQEQNAFPGMTNRILGKYIHLSFIPFPQSKDLFKNPVVVGNPIRKAIKSAAAQNKQKTDDNFVITIIGGSQGAHILNETLVKTLPLLEPISDRVQIIHQTGKKDYQWTISEYSKYPGINAEISEFIEDMGLLYHKSHLLICRAGSMVNEIIAMGKASILVPIAVSSGNHQKENA